LSIGFVGVGLFLGKNNFIFLILISILNFVSLLSLAITFIPFQL
jgi:hypothetical protein